LRMTHGTHSAYVHGCKCDLCREGEAAYQRDYRQRNRERLLEYERGRSSADRDDPVKRKARWDAWYYNREPRPCEECGAEGAERHHSDYSKPLEVRWLCKRCHGVEHRVPNTSWGCV
jgi:hypothetical protein